jgi:hypothetical protein
MSSTQILGKFQNSLVSFFDELIEMFPNEGEFVALRILVKDRIPITQIIGYFESVLQNKEIMTSIERRDDQFFLTNVLFSKIGNVDLFKNLWTSSQLDQDDKKAIWNWVDAFMKLTKQYINSK